MTGATPSLGDGPVPAELAARYGLSVSGARPGLATYTRLLWGRRHFIVAFSTAKLTAQYSQAKLGQVWQVATPLLNACVYYLVFGILLGTRRGIPHDVFVPFLVTGVFIFTFTQSSVTAGVRAISGNLGLVRALHFPRAALPVSIAIQQLQQLLYSMVILVATALVFGSYPSPRWVLVVPVLAIQFTFNVGITMVMARLGSKTPDLAQLTPFVMRTWMYASGVMYSIPVMLQGKPDWIKIALQHNPLAIYMDLMRYALIRGYGAENLPAHVWLFALAWALLLGVAGYIYFWKAEEQYGRG
ncbi:ABC transporter permease [Streptomyces montanisoli]|uniref:Transport permease protein n=1 Tax=Streptomyces montanisoli TaxID=2798581 RepID=A0A940RVY9_9ACTN|nr:ABC transporter permease [Streptomyces montanisoli]MBP0458875.1 ABC transporter permease [Streptomyces montanisoli]